MLIGVWKLFLNIRSVRRYENGYLSSACCGGKCSEAGGGKETGRKCTAQVLVDKISETGALQKCVHRLVHVTWMAISGDGVLAIICRYPTVTGDICIKKKVYQRLLHWYFCRFYNNRSRIFQIPWNSQDLCCLQWEWFTLRGSQWFLLIVHITINFYVNTCGTFSLF